MAEKTINDALSKGLGRFIAHSYINDAIKEMSYELRDLFAHEVMKHRVSISPDLNQEEQALIESTLLSFFERMFKDIPPNREERHGS